MRARKTRKGTSIVRPSMIRWWVRIAFRTNIVPIAIVSVTTGDSNHLEIANWTYGGQSTVLVTCFGMNLSFKWHDISLFAGVAKQQLPWIVPSRPSTITMLLEHHGLLAVAAQTKIFL
jgi:hypothetical protein